MTHSSCERFWIARAPACIDLSDYCQETLDYAVALAPKEANIIIINGINSRDPSAVRTVSAYFPEPDVVEQYIEKKYDRQKEQYPENDRGTVCRLPG